MNQYKHWKIVFDVFLSAFLVVLLLPLLIIIFIIASIDTQSGGIFFQRRIGQKGRSFVIYKFKTIQEKSAKISKIGLILRKFKLDELPQLFNILKLQMSFVGPRPDVEGYYDKLEGECRKVLELKPGITSEASIKYSNEENLLAQQENPLQYNDEVIFPDKVRMNLNYLENMSFSNDLRILKKTVFKVFIK